MTGPFDEPDAGAIPPRPGVEHFLGLDLGKVSDYAALAALEQEARAKPSAYTGTYLHRWPLGTSYPEIVEGMVRVLRGDSLEGRKVTLAVDATGAGLPVVEMFIQAKRRARLGVIIKPVVITGGHKVNHEGGARYVPKRVLVSTAQAVLQSGRFKFAGQLPEAATLIRELRDFQLRVTEAINDVYEGRKGSHDDLLLAVLLALWAGENKPQEEEEGVSWGYKTYF